LWLRRWASEFYYNVVGRGFSIALRQLLYQGTIYLRNRECLDLVDREYPKLSVRAANAEFVGWYNDQIRIRRGSLCRLPFRGKAI